MSHEKETKKSQYPLNSYAVYPILIPSGTETCRSAPASSTGSQQFLNCAVLPVFEMITDSWGSSKNIDHPQK